jgi:hypothetical protein
MRHGLMVLLSSMATLVAWNDELKAQALSNAALHKSAMPHTLTTGRQWRAKFWLISALPDHPPTQSWCQLNEIFSTKRKSALKGAFQKLQRAYFFSESLISRSNTTSSGVAAGAGAGSAALARLTSLTIWKMMKAKMMKFNKIVMKLP